MTSFNFRRTVLSFTLALLTLMTSPIHPQTVASLVDKNRVLLLFAPSDSSPLFQKQLTLLTHHAPDLADRDLVLLPILGKSSTILHDLHAHDVSPQEQLTLRHRFHIAPAHFTVLLLGKDGGEKLRSTTPLTIEKLTSLIDAMPMRQDEIRNCK